MERLTKVLTKTVVYTKGKYEDTTSAEMTTEDVRTVLKNLPNMKISVLLRN